MRESSSLEAVEMGNGAVQQAPPFYRIFLSVTAEDLSPASATANDLLEKSYRHADLFLIGTAASLEQLTGDAALAGRFQTIEIEGARHDDAFASIARDFAGEDFIFLRPGVRLPLYWDLRLAWTAYRKPGVATVSPVCERGAYTSLRLRRLADRLPEERLLNTDLLDSLCYAYCNLDTPDLPEFLQDCLFVRSAALRSVTARPPDLDAGYSFDAFLADTRQMRYSHVLADHVFVGAPLEEACAPKVFPSQKKNSGPLSGAAIKMLRGRIKNDLLGLTPQSAGAVRVQMMPRHLHITHSWGGGIDRWLQEYCRADHKHQNLVLRSSGPVGIFGLELSLYLSITDRKPVQRWTLSPGIKATDSDHPGYRAILTEIIDRYGVEAVVVSSLIGHALNALHCAVPVVMVCHDYYPFCPALNITFGETCTSCTPAELASCTADNPHNRFFDNLPPASWVELRKQFVNTIRDCDVKLIAPSPSVRNNSAKLMPELNQLWNIVPHGTRPVDGTAVTPAADSARPLRILVLGSLAPNKGQQLLLQMQERLAGFAELFLVGCGAYGNSFVGAPGVHVIPEYRWEELGSIVGGIKPDTGLLLSVVPETFSYTLQELFQLGIPPVATRTGSFVDRIEDGVNGFLVAPEAGEIVECLRRLAADRRLLGAAHERLRSQHVPQITGMLAKYSALLRSPDFSSKAYFCRATRGLADEGVLTHCQLFWRPSQGHFEESASCIVRTRLGERRQLISLTLPPQTMPVGQLRLDLTDKPGFLTIYSLRVINSHEECVWKWDCHPKSLRKTLQNQIDFLVRNPGGEPGVLTHLNGPDPYFSLPLEAAALAQLQAGGVIEIECAWRTPEQAALIMVESKADERNLEQDVDDRDTLIRQLAHGLVQAQANVTAAKTQSERSAKELEQARSSLAIRETELAGERSRLREVQKLISDPDGSLPSRTKRALHLLSGRRSPTPEEKS